MENKLTAKEAKEIADTINQTKVNDELALTLELIKRRVDKGEYMLSGAGSLMKETINELNELGYTYEEGGRMNEIDHNISWKELIKKPKTNLFYKESPYTKTDLEFLKALMTNYPNAYWGGKDWSTAFTDVVVVFESGVKGPAAWYYLNDSHRWAHGAYTAYKETYDNIEFGEMVLQTYKLNEKNRI